MIANGDLTELYDQLLMSDPSKLVVNVISDDLRYADGAEDEILSILESASDRSTSSDELASQIHDWPSRYHLSPSRKNLLRPLRVSPGVRVLEVGCGTGVNTRWFAEQGATVVAVEGTMARAQAARVRTAEFETVEIHAGDFLSFSSEEKFDFVVVVGVLEYSTAGSGGNSGPEKFLEHCVSFLAPGGVVVLAIENQFGLKYLLSYPEDHHGVPWVGLEGYRKGTPRTWSRMQLSSMLKAAGLTSQDWMQPFPDYKLPTIIVRESLYDLQGGPEVIKKFIRNPVRDFNGTPWITCDAQVAFQEVVDAGIGSHVPNSFLVVASSSEDSITNRTDTGVAWFASEGRRNSFCTARKIIKTDDGFVTEYLEGPSSAQPAVEQWVRNVGHQDGAVFDGLALDDEIVRAIIDRDEARAVELLHAYLVFLEDLDRQEVTDVATLNPFRPIESESAISGKYVDCIPQNLLLQRDGSLVLVDFEWILDGPCATELVQLRGLMLLAARLVTTGADTVFSDSHMTTVLDATMYLSRLAGLDFRKNLWDRLLAAEFEFQRIVAVPSRYSTGFNEYRKLWELDMHASSGAIPVSSLLRSYVDRNRLVAVLAETRSFLANVVSHRDGLLAERDGLLAERGGLLAERDDLKFHLRSASAKLRVMELELELIAEDRSRVSLHQQQRNDAGGGTS